MHVLVTGAAGFVGQALVDRLLGDSPGTLRPVSRLTAVDQRFGNDAQAWAADRRVLLHEGDFGAPALLDAALAWAPSAGIKRIELYVYKRNAPAIALYEACGFQVEGTRRGFIKEGDAYLDDVVMGCLL